MLARISLIGALLLGLAGAGHGQDRAIRKEIVVGASRAEIWNAWTTSKGAATFFAPQANIEATLGGPYEIYFLTDKPYGFRGSEGSRVHSIVPMQSLAFTWSAPPQFPEIRALRSTIVYLRFEELGPRKVRVSLTHLGWGEGRQWDAVYSYFTRAWDIVLGHLQYRYAHGPIDWSNPPKVTESFDAKSF